MLHPHSASAQPLPTPAPGFALAFTVKGHLRAYWHHLTRLVLNSPCDLINHTRRVLICQTPELSNVLAGSLLDLFIILGHSGEQLRHRMLSGSHRYLSRQQYTTLEAWPTPPEQPLYLPGSVFLHYREPLGSELFLGDQSRDGST